MKKLVLFTALSLLVMFAVASAQNNIEKFGDNNKRGNAFINNFDGSGPHGNARFNDCDGHGRQGGKAGMRGRGNEGRNFRGHGNKGQRGMGQRGHRGMGVEMIIQKAEWLELTEKQVTDLKDMAFDAQMEKVDLMADVKKAQIKLKTLHRDEASERELFNAIDQLADLKANVQKMRISHKNAVKDVLTEAQLEKLKSAGKRQFIIEKEIYFDDDGELDSEEHEGENIEKRIIKRRG